MPSSDLTAARLFFARVLAVLTLGYTLLLVWATHYPKPELILGPSPPPDKTLHFVAYGVLAALVAATFAVSRRRTLLRSAMLPAGLATFAVVDEITQPFFNRHADPLDWVYDCLGIALGLVAVAVAVAAVRWMRGRQAQLGVGGR